jgi:ribonuclease BN (tRNA processing enzyme)
VKATVRFVGSGDAFGSGGRFQTCILVDAAGTRFAIDFGASSLIALSQQGIAHNTIDTVLLTHLHGDHCAGVPFMLMDAMLGARRDRALTIAGPPGTRSRMEAIREALFPGSAVMAPRFPIEYVEMAVGRSHVIGQLQVTPYPAKHTAETNPTSLRVAVGDTVIAYTGDTEWTDELVRMGNGADLVIAECYFFDKPVKWHLNYPTLARHLNELGAKRVILTHMSREMLGHVADIPLETAHDGMVVEL